MGSIQEEENKLVALIANLNKEGKHVKLPFIALLFASIGIHFLFGSHAATSSIGVRPADGTISGNAVVVSDPDASGGKALQFGSAPTSIPDPTSNQSGSCQGPTVTVSGAAAYRKDDPADGTAINASNWQAVTGTDKTNGQAFSAGLSTFPAHICVLGGLVNGQLSHGLDWEHIQSLPGSIGFTVGTSGLADISRIRVHNVGIGLKPLECAPVNSSCAAGNVNTGSYLLRGAYFTDIRSIAVDDDSFMTGTISDSLFDGVWSFLSERQTASNGSGGNASTSITITHSYIRLYATNPPHNGSGQWFDWRGAGPHHTPVISGSVFAVDSQPSGGWSQLVFPAGTQWKEGNTIVWLGTPGAYQGPKPTGVTFLEGQAARDKWQSVRSTWLSSHHYSSDHSTSLDPDDDPVSAPE